MQKNSFRHTEENNVTFSLIMFRQWLQISAFSFILASLNQAKS